MIEAAQVQSRNRHLRCLGLLGVSAATLIVLGCSDRSQELENRVVDLKKRIEQLESQLSAAEQKNEQGSSSTQSTNSTAVPTKETLESSYETSCKKLKDDIVAKLKGFRIENYTTHSVQMPDSLYPFASEISLSVRSDDGKAYQMDLPVKANYAGEWVFPDADEIVTRINSAKKIAPVTEQEATRSNASPPQNFDHNRPPIMNADGTVTIQWGDSEKSNARSRRSPDSASKDRLDESRESRPEPGSGTEAPSRTKSPVMPVDRDVHIQFSPPPK